MHSCTIADAETKQKRTAAPRPTCMPEQKGEHAPTNGQKHHGYSGGYALQHNELPIIGIHPPGTDALVSPVSRNLLQWLMCTMPDNISQGITTRMSVTPNSMTSPSRVVNFDRFMAPPHHEGFETEGSTVLTVLPSPTGSSC
jgi:hypothetical protein